MRKRKSLPLPRYPLIPDALYTVQESGGHLHRGESTVWTYIKRGLLEVVKIGGHGTLVTGRSLINCANPERPNKNIPQLRKSREVRRV